VRRSDAETIAAHYDHLAPEYDQRWMRYVQEEASWVIDQWPESIHRGLALDLGCAAGTLLAALRRRQPQLLLAGVDLSPAMLDQARARAPEAHFMTGDIEDPDFVATLPRAEVVLSLSLLHHLRNVNGHLQLLHDLVKPGGVVFLADFAVDGLVMRLAERYFRVRHPYHRTALSHRDLRARLDRRFPPEATRCAILRPDHFWRIQIFRLSRA